MKKLQILTSALIFGAMSLNLNAQENVPTAVKMNTEKTNGTDDTIADTGTIGLSNWSAFNTLAKDMTTLDGATYRQTRKIVKGMGTTVTLLDDTRPMWMNTEEINEDIADFQKEYNELVTDKKLTENEYRENLEEIAEKFEDLREEADEVFMEYVKINRKANEEYREEAKDGEMKDAREEYNEQIKELKEVRDGDK